MKVAELGSFSKAASELGVGQSAVSQQVRRLESEMGHSLFERTKSGLSLNTNGEGYLVFAKAIVSLGEEAKRYFAQPRAAGALRLGLIEEYSRTLLMPVLLAFKRIFPDYELSVSCDTSQQLLADADDGRYDIVIMKGSANEDRGQIVGRLPLVWVGPAGLPLPDLDPVPLVVALQPDPVREIALRSLREAGRTWRIQFQSSSLSAMEAAVGAGFGISVTGEPLPLRGVVPLGPSSGLPSLPGHDIVFLCGNKSKSSDDGIGALRSIVQAVFDDLP